MSNNINPAINFMVKNTERMAGSEKSRPIDIARRMSGHPGTGILGVARVNFHQKIIIESNVPLGQRENKGSSSVPDECRGTLQPNAKLPFDLKFQQD